jgi:nucleoside-diphosphate-sugar epimerase
MKALFIGGTGNISTSVSRLAIARGIDLYLLNRGVRRVEIPGATILQGDIADAGATAALLRDHHWDVVVDWIAYTADQVERDIDLFRGRTRQYIFISSASAYQKPLLHPVITESTPLCNPFWEYSRNKIACEELLTRVYREEGFPMTVVRPSHTYDTIIPALIGSGTEYTLIDRMKRGAKVIVHGDGTTLWTLTHAEDFAVGFVGLMGHQQAIGHAFHITSDESLTWNQVFRTLGEAIGVEPQIVHIPSDFICRQEPSLTGNLLGDKAYSVLFDNSKIKRFVPEFKAVIPYHQGVRRTLAWFAADPARQVVNAQTNAVMERILQAYER